MRPNRRGINSARAIDSTDTTSMKVPIALIVGLTPNLICVQIRTGSGCGDSPVVKNDNTKSSNDRAKTSSPAASTAGQSAGRVTA